MSVNALPIALQQAPAGYADWLAELKTRIHRAQQRAARAVNHELVLLYWQIGSDIVARQHAQGWGAKVIERLAHDLRTAFPDMQGLSPRNLKYMRAFAEAWPDAEFVQAVLAQLPWYHQLALLDKLSNAQALPNTTPLPIATVAKFATVQTEGGRESDFDKAIKGIEKKGNRHE